MKLACLSFTESGEILGEDLVNVQDYEIVHFRNKSIKGGIKSIMERLWKDYDGLIFISATGIASRFIAPFIKDKTKDPAIVVIDDQGKFAISLLSGHLGGANEIAENISKRIEAIPVITTASDNRGFDSIDIFAKNNDYYMEDMKSITRLTGLMVNNRKIGFFTEDKKVINYSNIRVLDNLDNIEDLDGVIIVSSQNIELEGIDYAILRPKNINIGIGCRKGVEGKRIIQAIEEALSTVNISTRSIKNMGTVEVKKDEQGIIEGAQFYNCPLNIFTIEDIKKVEDKFSKSQFVKDTIGVYSVSEPCAYLLGGKIILPKSRHNGITITISKEEENG